MPRHIAIVMDGNGRWAEARGEPRTVGHKAGLDPVRMCIREFARRDVKALTLFAFSSENWRRPEAEVAALRNGGRRELPFPHPPRPSSEQGG